ncbi:MAG: hypothetical protein AAGF12_13920 [Myxococcota bacterium]
MGWGLEALGSRDDIYLFVVGDLMIQVNRGRDTEESVSWVEETVLAHHRLHAPRKMAHIVVLESGVRPPDMQMRRRLGEAMDKLEPALSSEAVIFHGRGFFVGMVIAVASVLMADKTKNRKLCRSTEEGARYVWESLRSPLSVQQVVEMIEAARKGAARQDRTPRSPDREPMDR